MSVLNSAISSNRQMYQNLSNSSVKSNKMYLINSYTTDKTQYYNDQKALKKQKRRKRNKILTLSFAGVATSLVAFGLIFELAKKGKFDELLSRTQSLLNKFKNKTGDIVNQATQEIGNAKETGKKFVNLSVNSSNLKDNICATIFEKLGLSGFNEKLENVYNGFSKIKYQKEYEKIVKDLPQELQEKYNYSNWFDEIIKDVKGKLKGEGVKNFTKEMFENFDIQKDLPLKDKIKTIFAKMSNEIIADNKLTEIRAKYSNAIDCSGMVLDENQLNKIKELDKLRQRASEEIISRARDTVLGNPTADMTGVGVSLGLLGGAIVTADDREERKSTMINLGIPLITTLGTMTYAAARCIAGGKALLFGLATGTIASTVAGAIDNKIKAKQKELEQNQI